MDETDFSAAAAAAADPGHHPEHPEELRENRRTPTFRQNPLQWLRHHWEAVLMVALVGFVAFLTVDLLRPVPRAVIRLEPYHASAGPSAASVADASSGEPPSEAATTQTDPADALAEESDSGAPVGALPAADETSGIARSDSAEAGKTPGIAREGYAEAEKTKDKHRKKAKKHGHAEKKSKHPALVRLNVATLEQLQQLPGIGPKIARRVLDYRREHGRFSSVEEIMEVKGIGPKKFEKMKPYLRV